MGTSFKTGAAIDYNAYPNVGALIGQLLLAFYADKLPRALNDLPITKDLINKEIKIADMGCGEGRSTQSLARIFKKADVIGFDLDHDSIVCAQSNNSNERVKFIEKRRQNAPIEWAHFSGRIARRRQLQRGDLGR